MIAFTASSAESTAGEMPRSVIGAAGPERWHGRRGERREVELGGDRAGVL